MSISALVAIRPFTSTLLSFPKKKPLGLMRITFPLALSLPKIFDGSALLTLFSTVALEDGWENSVCSSTSISKLFQSIIALSVVCWIYKVSPSLTMVAAPPTTSPPSGFAMAGVERRARQTVMLTLLKKLRNDVLCRAVAITISKD